MTETFYDVLGVSSDASQGEIEAAYRERIKETHPDLNDDENADVATQRVIEARDVLTDEEERAHYDEVGHAVYVGTGDNSDDPTTDSDDGTAASRAARSAGWGETDTSGPTESTAAGTNAGPSERRQRERTASDRVSQERTSQAERGDTDGESGATTDGGTASAGGATASTGRSANRRTGQNYDTSTWNGNTGYNVRQDVGPTRHPLRTFLSNTSLSLTLVTFFLYPVLLFSTLFPPFPLVVNVTVGLCTLFLVGYLQSQPSVGIIVFGGWTAIVLGGLFAFGVALSNPVAILAVAGVVLPLCFSLLIHSMLRL